MRHNHFDQKIFNGMEMPWQQLMDLNMKTMQHMSFMKPGDLMEIKKPEDLFEKNMGMFLQNSHMVFNHLRDALNIIESHLVQTPSYPEERSVAPVVPKAKTPTVKKTVKKSASAVKSAVKKVAPKTSVKKATAKFAVKKVAAKPAHH